MKKFPIPQLSVIIPVKIDTDDRLRNLEFNLEYFETFFTKYEIILIEQGEESKLGTLNTGSKNIKHFFLLSKGCHCQSRNLNLGTSLATRQIVMILDIDVICHPDSIIQAINLIKNGASFVAPYNGVATEIRKTFYLNGKNINDIVNNLVFFPKDHNLRFNEYDYSAMHPLYGDSKSDNTGGCLIYKKQAFYAIGGWNNNFISYGFQDLEFVYRLEKLGYELKRFDNYNIYHLEHKRGTDSSYNNFFHINQQEYLNVLSMTALELLEYALNGFKKIVLDNRKEMVLTNTNLIYSIEVIDTKKMNLDDLSIIIPLNASNTIPLSSLKILIAYFEIYFVNYELILIESKYKCFQNMQFLKNIRYIWMGTEKLSLEEMISKGIEESTTSYIALWDYFTLINPKTFYKKFKSISKTRECKLKDTNWYLKGVQKIQRGTGVTLINKYYSLTT